MRAVLDGLDIFVKVECRGHMEREKDSGCTSVFALGAAALNGLTELADRCSDEIGSPCKIEVTGGTEFWEHSSHGPNIGSVDLRNYGSRSALNRWIKDMAGTRLPNNACYPLKPAWQVGSHVYVEEDSGHWHVCYN